MDNYKLSIALITRNRPDLLETCMANLHLQPKLWFEIIVSDDSSTEDFIIQNKKVLEKYIVKYVEGPKKGLYANRNYAAKNCSGTHIRTMDDDHTFPANHIKICLDKIAEDPNAVWNIGEYNPTETILSVPHLAPPELHPRGFSVTPIDPQNSRVVSCGATIYPRQIIDLRILNNEEFKFGSSYLEYGARLKYLGYRLRHINETYIIHHFDFATRSYNNEIEILNSNIYAIMSLSYVYEKTIKNIFLTSSRLFYLLITDFKISKNLIFENFKRVKLLKKSLKSNTNLLNPSV